MRWVAALLLGLTLGGCSVLHTTLALYKPTSQFIPLSTDKRVRYEPGAEELAAMAARALPAAIRTVEAAQYGPFLQPVVVYVCATDDSYYSYGAPDKTVGFVLNQRLFLSPRLTAAPQSDIDALLTHELAHLHLNQRIGLAQFAHLPVWFKEGLATEVAQGGGALGVSDFQAARALTEGHAFTPVKHGNLLFAESANSFGLSPLLFYRQSALFVRYLRDTQPRAFKQLFLSLEEQSGFEQAFEKAYGEPLESAWKHFMRVIKVDVAHSPSAADPRHLSFAS